MVIDSLGAATSDEYAEIGIGGYGIVVRYMGILNSGVHVTQINCWGFAMMIRSILQEELSVFEVTARRLR